MSRVRVCEVKASGIRVWGVPVSEFKVQGLGMPEIEGYLADEGWSRRIAYVAGFEFKTFP